MTGTRNSEQGGDRSSERNDENRRLSAKDLKTRNTGKVRDASYGHGGRDTDGAGTSGNVEGYNAGGEPEGRDGPRGD